LDTTRLLTPYRAGDSPVHRLPAGPKLLLALAGILGVVLLPRFAWPAYAVAAGVIVAVAMLSRVPARYLLSRLLMLEPFALGVALLALFPPGGIDLFLSVLVKSTLCLSLMVILTVTTRFSDMLQVSWRIGVPPLLVTTLALMHRYLFVLVDEMQRMLRARRSRSFTRARAQAWRDSSQVGAQLFLRSSERAERIYSAMCARGWKT
jgi:cobalt/nickel transport system permease protein